MEIKLKKEERKKEDEERAAAGLEPIKRIKYKVGTVALREVRRYQKSVDVLLPRASFQRLVREIATEIDNEIRFAPAALFAIQEAAEAYMVGMFEDANMCSLHAKRQTVTKADLDLARRIRGDGHFDFTDKMQKSGNEEFISLPMRGKFKEGMEELQKKIGPSAQVQENKAKMSQSQSQSQPKTQATQ